MAASMAGAAFRRVSHSMIESAIGTTVRPWRSMTSHQCGRGLGGHGSRDGPTLAGHHAAPLALRDGPVAFRVGIL